MTVAGPHPPSPCVEVCTLDASGRYCLGCLRTLEEIAGWGAFSGEEKRAVLRALERRRRGPRAGSERAGEPQ